ncbi:MAG: NifU family protein [Bacteroides sp.]|jgi:hypothetical protein
MVSKELMDKIEAAIASIRPYMQSDGGDLELESVTEDMVVRVRFIGTCGTCPYSSMTLRNGVVEAIKQHAPEIREVIAVDA